MEQQQKLASGGGGGPHFPDEDVNNSSSSGNRWPREETLALLKIRSDMDSLFRDATLKAPLWDEVSRKLMELGYKRNSKKCKEKFENVHKYYKRTKEGKGGTRQDGKSYRFFSELEAMYNITINNNPQPNSQNLAPQYQPQMQVSAPTPIASAPPSTLNAPSKLISFSSTNSFSSEFEEDDREEEERAIESNNTKRKRDDGSSNDNHHNNNSEGKIMEFFEGLMKQVMERQEQMQKSFMEALEKREQERLAREEAWRRQEMARIARESEIAANERAAVAARDQIICSFLQKKATGDPTIPAPAPAPAPATPATTATPQAQKQNALALVETPIASQIVDPTSSRWPKGEVHALIRLRSELDSRYQDNGAKGPLWEEISYGMQRLGYNRNAKRCKEKWENINKYFRKVKESNKKRPEDAKTCPYFHQLDALYRNKGFNNNGGGAGLNLSPNPNPNPSPISVVAPMMEEEVKCKNGDGGESSNGGVGNAPSRDLFGGGDSVIMKKPEDIVKELTVRSNDSSNAENVDGDEEYDEE